MIKSWDSYKKRYELESYFTAPPSTYANNKDCILVISHSTVLDMSEIFFTEQKKYFIKAIRNSDYMVLPITALLFHHQEYDLEKVVQFIE